MNRPSPQHSTSLWRLAECRHIRVIALFSILMVSTGCVPTRWKSDGPPEAEPVSRPSGSASSTQRSTQGNPPFYEVFGQRYYVMESSVGYREQGVASWYGKKFHGNPTSSGEIYDMYAMTAAHKSLPLPTDVRVTNLRNGKSVVVRVNDRGPFVHNRLIDLSYSAARELDMIRSGTTLVEVAAVTDGPPDPAPVLAEANEPPLITVSINPIAAASAEPTMDTEVVSLYLQVGAFGEQLNARNLKYLLEMNGIDNVVIRYDAAGDPALYRVRLGPIGDVTEYDTLVDRVAALDIRDTHLVTETADVEAAELSTAGSEVLPGG